jgi:fatty-acyl-CoA synthase/long-chain acyl-CoA synthetase
MTHPTITFQFLMTNALKKFSGKVFTELEGVEYSYNDVHLNSNRVANGIAALGFGPGDRIALAMPNGQEIIYGMFGVIKSGATIVSINMMVSDDNLLFMLQDADVKMVMVDLETEKRILKLIDQLPGLKAIVTRGGQTGDHIIAWDDFTEDQDTADPQMAALPEDDAYVIYTGGTTGKPKGVVHSQASSYYMMIAQSIGLSFLPSDTLMLMTPLAHSAGAIMYLGCLNGTSFIVEKKPDYIHMLDLISKGKVTVLFLVPTIIYLLLDVLKEGNYDISSLRMLLYGASPISENRLKEALEIFGPIFIQLYGQTECPQIVMTMSMDDHEKAMTNPKLLSSCGKPSQMASVRIVDDNGNEVPTGEVGEIIVNAPFTMKGYLNNPDLTASVMRDGWLHTGDMGTFDEEGYVYIVDRKKDMVISGGFNVYSTTVENVLSRHPKVKQAAVIGIPDEKWGEKVTAVVVPDGDVSVEEILVFCKGRLNQYELPKQVVFQEQIPITGIGKVDKKALRAPFSKGSERAVN